MGPGPHRGLIVGATLIVRKRLVGEAVSREAWPDLAHIER